MNIIPNQNLDLVCEYKNQNGCWEFNLNHLMLQLLPERFEIDGSRNDYHYFRNLEHNTGIVFYVVPQHNMVAFSNYRNTRYGSDGKYQSAEGENIHLNEYVALTYRQPIFGEDVVRCLATVVCTGDKALNRNGMTPEKVAGMFSSRDYRD